MEFGENQASNDVDTYDWRYPSISGEQDLQQNQLKTANERSLYKLWKAAEQRIVHLETAISQLQSRLTRKGHKEEPSYLTDETEFDSDVREERDVNKETEYILVKSKRTRTKRKDVSSPEISPKIPIKAAGKATQQPQNRVAKEQAPPTIYAITIKYHDLEQGIGPNNSKIKITNQPHPEQFKINCIGHEEYRRLSNVFSERKIEWYTFSDKQNKPIRVMAKGLHAETDPEAIKTDLARNKLKILSVVCKEW